MAKSRALVSFLDVGVRLLAPIADAIEEVLQVRPLDLARLVRRFDAICYAPAGLVVENERAFLAVERDARRFAFATRLGPDAVLPREACAGEVERGNVRIRRVMIVVVEQNAAGSADARGRFEAEEHARD